MAKLIRLADRSGGHDNLIATEPLELRRGDWPTGWALLCTRVESEHFEDHRRGALGLPGHAHIAFLPVHLKLDGGCHYTLLGLVRNRHDPARMQRVYRLAGLMECVTNAASPVLRTDLLRRVYQNILDEREQLQVVWKGKADQFLLQLYSDHYNRDVFFHRIRSAATLKELYLAVEEQSAEQWRLLCRHYVIYLPAAFPAR